MKEAHPHTALPAGSPEDAAVVLFTSGSEGKPKDTHENGYGAYTMTVASGSGLNNPDKSGIEIALRGRQIVISEQVKTAEIYSVSGVRLAAAYNTSEIAAPDLKGIYIVRVTDNFGTKKVQKIAVQ